VCVCVRMCVCVFVCSVVCLLVGWLGCSRPDLAHARAFATALATFTLRGLPMLRTLYRWACPSVILHHSRLLNTLASPCAFLRVRDCKCDLCMFRLS
jgi:hypothetical protein